MSTYIKGAFEISTDKGRLQLNVIHKYLSEEAYWCKNIPLETVAKSIEHSCCFGLYHKEEQIGFARVITDYATYSYLADVFILQIYRGRGLSKWLVQTIMEHPALQGMRKWVLGTRDAHGLYAKYAGFTPLKEPGKFMELHFPDIYKPG
ncbi:MAG TPA: N-acetyltransferase [Bacteroidetes bacterium]|nr:N-acetyltransferase [Bacteroidota bacterium]